jgi:hypothetical protein
LKDWVLSASEQNNNLSSWKKADIQKAVAIAFLGIFGAGIIYFFTQADVSKISIAGVLDINVFIGPFIGIIIGIFTWLGFKQGQSGK